MDFQIIYGRAGCGKSSFCIEDIKKRWQEDPDKTMILMVPEQFTLQTERNLVKSLSVSGLGRPEVLSFRRLARRVLDEVGGGSRQHIDKAGKAMIIHSILKDKRDGLRAFARAAGQKGFINKLSLIFSEFKRYNLDPLLLEDSIPQIQDRFLKDKLEDLSLIYSNYERILHTRYIDTDDDLTMLIERIARSTMLKGAELWLDEFSGFTPQEYSIIEELFKVADRMSISLCTDCIEDFTEIQDIDVFLPSKYTANKLIKLAHKTGVRMERPISLNMDIPYRFKDSPALHHAEKYFFSYPHEVFRKKTDSINVLAVSNPYSEVEAIAIELVKQSRDKGMRFKDMAVLARNIEDYEKFIRIIFTQYNIPFFIDKKTAITNHPLTLLILSAIQILEKNFSYETVFRYLKTGLLKIPREDIDIIENYVLSNGIRGSQWYKKKTWEYRQNFSLDDGEMSEEEKDFIERINAIRQDICKPLLKLKDGFKASKNARDCCHSLYQFLADIEVTQTIEELYGYYKEKGQLELAEEYRQIWDMIMDVLDQIVEASGEEKCKTVHFLELLSIGFAEHDMGSIPHAIDQVLVGSADRWRSHEIQGLFILGANDGVFPAATKDEGMLSDKDRAALREIGLELAPDTKSQTFEEQFLLYNSLTKAGKYLHISYPISDDEGKALRPSMIINRLASIFPNMSKESLILGEKNPIETIAAPLPSFNNMISALREISKGNKELAGRWEHIYLWFIGQEKWQKKLEYANHGLLYTNEEALLSKDKVKRMYGKTYYSSVSRIERYAACPFSFYVQYGLRAKERKILKMGAPDIGSFLHEIISRFSEGIKEEGLNWKTVEESDWEALVDLIIEELIEGSPNLPLKRSKRYVYLKERLGRLVKRSIWLIIQQVKDSGFEPILYEIAFGGKDGLPALTLKLAGGEKVVLTGRIDRIDLLKGDEGNYIRIIDYKSGSKGFRLSDVYNGLELQLITYLSAIWEKGIKGIADEVQPAGMLYLRLDDPIIRTKGRGDIDIDLETMKEMKMRGLVISDIDIIKQMDKGIDGYSTIIPVNIKNDGTLGKNSAVASIEQFEILRNHAKESLNKILEEMIKGDISISPYKQKKYTSCNYCPYSSICRFEGDMNKYRIINDIKTKEVWDILEKEDKAKRGELHD